MIAHITIGLELHLVSPIQPLHAKTSWERIGTSVGRALPTMAWGMMRYWEGETFKTYSDRYWETYNEIDGGFEDVAVRTFKVRLPTEHELRKLLTMKLALNLHQLITLF